VRWDDPLGDELFRILFSDLSGDVVPSASLSGPSHSGRGRIGPFAVILRPGLALDGVLSLLQDHVQKLVDAVPQTCRPGEHFPASSSSSSSSPRASTSSSISSSDANNDAASELE
jgi:hypothetical protein